MEFYQVKQVRNSDFTYDKVDILAVRDRGLIGLHVFDYSAGDAYFGIMLLWGLVGISAYLDKSLNRDQGVHFSLGFRIWRFEFTIKGTYWYAQ